MFLGEERATVIERVLRQQVVQDFALNQQLEVKKSSKFEAISIEVLLAPQVFVGIGLQLPLGLRKSQLLGHLVQPEDFFQPAGSCLAP